jgi:SAM-dependent methyltransferase
MHHETMTPFFANVYEDAARARAYSDLQFPGTYYLAFRDIPELLRTHVHGKEALDFGCGAGRSTRFLKDQGFRVLGVDISEAMLRHALESDSEGEYRLVGEGDLTSLGARRFDLVFCAFTFDNVPSRAMREELFRQLGARLNPGGRIINLVSAPEIYVNEWLSFSTQSFPENRNAQSGDLVRITILDLVDSRPIEDLLWTDADYRATFALTGLELLETHRPLGLSSDPYQWVSEQSVSPWTIYVCRARALHGYPAE